MVPLLAAALGLALAIAFGAYWLAARAFGVRGGHLLAFRPRPEYYESGIAARFAARVAPVVAVYLAAGAIIGAGARASGRWVDGTRIAVLSRVSPARRAGLVDGDRLRSIAGEPVATGDEIRRAVREQMGVPFEVRFERNGRELTARVTPDAEGRMGVLPIGDRAPVSLAEAACIALREPAVAAPRTLSNLAVGLGAVGPGGNARGRAEVAGPIAIMGETARAKPASGEALSTFGDVLALGWPPVLALALLTGILAETDPRARCRAGRS